MKGQRLRDSLAGFFGRRLRAVVVLLAVFSGVGLLARVGLS